MDEGHEHRFVVRGARGRSDYRLDFASCECGLERRRRFLDSRLVELRYRFVGHDWLDPVKLLTLDLGLILCPRCEGQEYDIGVCRLCGSLGVLDNDAERIVA